MRTLTSSYDSANATGMEHQLRSCIGHGTLRAVFSEDVDAVSNLITAAMNPDEGAQARKTLRFHLDCQKHGLDDGRSYFALSEKNDIFGIGGLHHYAWGPKENVWLGWFAVDPAHQGQGHGSKLMESVLQQAREAGYRKLFVETYSTPEFAKARHFYAARGFQAAGRVTAYLPNGGDMVVLEKDL